MTELSPTAQAWPRAGMQLARAVVLHSAVCDRRGRNGAALPLHSASLSEPTSQPTQPLRCVVVIRCASTCCLAPSLSLLLSVPSPLLLSHSASRLLPLCLPASSSNAPCTAAWPLRLFRCRALSHPAFSCVCTA